MNMDSTSSQQSNQAEASGVTSGPVQFVGDIVALIVALGGGAAVSDFAPPIESKGVLMAGTIGLGSIAWLIAVVLAQKWKKLSYDSYRRKLVKTAKVTAAILFAAFLAYVVARFIFTTDYQGKRVPIGFVLTEQGSKYLKENSSTNSELLMAAAGKADWVWRAWSILIGEIFMLAVFIPFITAPIFSIVFAWHSLRFVTLPSKADH